MSDNPTTTSVVRIYRFPALPKAMLARISAGRSEAARVWMHCRDLHHAARKDRTPWPWRDALQKSTKGQFALHSQTVQMIGHAFLANIETTLQLRKAGNRKARYPWRDKRYYPLLWPAQAVAVQGKHLILPMGRGQASIVLPLPDNFVAGGCKLVWDGAANALHVTVKVPAEAPTAATGKATVDLGQVHQAAVTTTAGPALIVSGRGQRSLKRRNNKLQGEIARLQSRCTKGSRRWKKLARARHRHSGRIERQVRDLAHKGTTAVVHLCVANGVGEVFVGDPHGVRRRKSGKKHNQRMGQWEYGRDLRYLQQKLKRAGIACSTGSERGTSSRCPRCGHRHKPRGRVWQCKACGFTGHRDLVGSVNMHEDNFEKLVKFPSLVDTTYLRPGAMVLAHAGGLKSRRRGSSSRPGTGHGEGASPPAPVLLLELNRDTACGKAGRAPDGAGHLIERSTEAHSL